MPMTLRTGLACFLAHSNGASMDVLRSSTIPEFKLLVLLGGGLIVLAALVRRHYPLGGVAAPKSMQLEVWISPPEIADQMSVGDTR